MSTVLDTRVIRMTRWLVDQDRSRSTADMAADLGLSERVIRYRLGTVEKFLESEGASLSRQRGRGLLVTADEATRSRVRQDLAGRMKAPRVYAPEEREHLLIAALLWATPEVIPLDRLNLELEVSKTSARRDLQRCEPWLERNGLPLLRKPGQGLVVTGTEREIRRAIVQLFLESVPRDVLDELTNLDFADAQLVTTRVPEGLRDRIKKLPLRACALAVRDSSLHFGSAGGDSELVFSLYLAVSAVRSDSGNEMTMDAGQLVSLLDHPASGAIRQLFSRLRDGGVDLPTEEVPGVTEYLLGLDALATVQQEPLDVSGTLDRLLTEAGRRLHPSLREDSELRTGLALHLGRLAVRLRHGLPIHNPLLSEVAERYPDVYSVVTDLAEELGRELQATLNADEIGFITMYLSGAMERSHLRPRRRALVVCPSGMATVWVLVSRIQAEFPELELAEVLSAKAYEELDETKYDLVISTIPLPEQTAPIVVVGPLLSANDVRRVNLALSPATP